MKKQVIRSKSDALRICPLANDMWQVQQFKPLNNDTGGDPRYDPWKPVHRPTSLCVAQWQLQAQEALQR